MHYPFRLFKKRVHGNHTEIVPIGIAVDLCKVGAVLPDVCIERWHTAKALAETLSVPLQGEFVNTALVEHLFFSVFKGESAI